MRYRFDDFELDTECFELTRSGVALATEPQVIELLVMLVQNRHRMLSKEEINDTVWRGRIVSDSALSSRIKIARRLLEDDGRTQRYIRTVHKKGFRFVAPVEEIAAEKVAVSEAPEPPSADPGPACPPREPFTHSAKPAVAVLPFTNLSTDPDQEYFSDGITTDIISNLSKHRWLDVVARNTTFGLKGRATNLQVLGQTLGVDYVVEGSVQRSGDRVRVNVHLTDCHTGHTQWADRYNRQIVDIFDLQDDITETIAARLEPEIGYAERNKVVHNRPANLEAWDCYHLGVYHFYRFTGPDNREAQCLLRQSQELDPFFGEAFAWWAYAVILGMVYWDTRPTEALLNEALQACDQALALVPNNATFHALRARVLLARREYGSAINENRIAIELNPTFAAAYCGLGDSLAYETRYDEALRNFRKSITLSPNDPQMWAFLTYGALAMIFQGDYEMALEWTERAATIPNCQYWTTAHRAVALAYLNRPTEAAAAVVRLRQELPGFSVSFAREKLFYLKEQTQIERYLEGLRLAGVPETVPALAG
ncbi:winged helix-turn-helix domain-containing tetratricopeptide repeat protein [Marinobacter pelagius]|uniref:winged helix-turn-helix domain-containing tetratricopeptide repeat protein n=1 Tax=Marinobacter sp. C7 TaxID=2951363 RepID=UPI001EF111E0|nr:winged helix-turn-helix domain-containing tetratricopeptide repeat protein [Marinobacter sp. C7]MCG7199950.1 winged helix-turn-helix domain-containing tetratricopeptide repeat protein [Marinobacter sp. C7]